jgi:hypothetical protein
MKTNTKKTAPAVFTHEGAKAKVISPEDMLRRSVMSCMLFEDEFYEDGVEIAQRIRSLIPLVDPVAVAGIAMVARQDMKLRHIPLLIVREMARLDTHKHLVASTLADVIKRPDELTEFLALYWKDRPDPQRAKVSTQIKKGLAAAFTKFDEYQLAKYNRDAKVTLKDALFVSHPKGTKEQHKLWKKLANDKLETPATWEVLLSGGASKKDTFEALLAENKLGALALLRNLRNMEQAGVSPTLITAGLQTMNVERVLPFRFIAAARHAPRYEAELEEALMRSLLSKQKLEGRTALMVDVSGSMRPALSGKSDMTRMDAAAGLAMVLREVCTQIRVFTFSDKIVEVPARHGFALRDAVITSQAHNGTQLGAAVATINSIGYDRLIVITDEQSHDRVDDPTGLGYMINVASYRNGVGYGPWLHIDGFSEAVVDYITEAEGDTYL